MNEETKPVETEEAIDHKKINEELRLEIDILKEEIESKDVLMEDLIKTVEKLEKENKVPSVKLTVEKVVKFKYLGKHLNDTDCGKMVEGTIIECKESKYKELVADFGKEDFKLVK